MRYLKINLWGIIKMFSKILYNYYKLKIFSEDKLKEKKCKKKNYWGKIKGTSFSNSLTQPKVAPPSHYQIGDD